MLNSNSFDTTVDRTKGVEATNSGAWFQIVGDIPTSLRLALNDASGIQIPVASYQVYRVPFRRLFVFHDAGLAKRKFSIISGEATDDASAISMNIVRSGQFWETKRVPQFMYQQAWDSTVAPQTIDVLIPPKGKRFRVFSFRAYASGAATLAVAGNARYRCQDFTAPNTIGEANVMLPVTGAATDRGMIDTTATLFGNGYVSTTDSDGVSAGKLTLVIVSQISAGFVTTELAYSVED